MNFILNGAPLTSKLFWQLFSIAQHGRRGGGEESWADGYFASMISEHRNEQMIGKHVRSQVNACQKRYADYQLTLF